MQQVMKTATFMAAIGFDTGCGLKAFRPLPQSRKKTAKKSSIPNARSEGKRKQAQEHQEMPFQNRNFQYSKTHKKTQSGISQTDKGPGRRTRGSHLTGTKKLPTPSQTQKVPQSKSGTKLNTTLADARKYFRHCEVDEEQKKEFRKFYKAGLKEQIDQALRRQKFKKAASLMKYFLHKFIMKPKPLKGLKGDLRIDQDFIVQWKRLNALKNGSDHCEPQKGRSNSTASTVSSTASEISTARAQSGTNGSPTLDLQEELDKAIAEVDKAMADDENVSTTCQTLIRNKDDQKAKDKLAWFITADGELEADLIKRVDAITADPKLLTYVMKNPSQLVTVAAFAFQPDLLMYLKENPLQLPRVIALTEEQDLWQYLFNNISQLRTAVGISEHHTGVNVSDIQWFNLLQRYSEQEFLHSADSSLYSSIPDFSRQLPEGSFKFFKENSHRIRYFVAEYLVDRKKAMSDISVVVLYHRLTALATK